MGTNTKRLTPQDVHQSIGTYMLADGFDMVLDLDKSHGAYLHDSRTQTDYLDFFTCFAVLRVCS